MSSYGPPPDAPQDPSGQHPQGPPPYGQPPYGQPGYGPPLPQQPPPYGQTYGRYGQYGGYAPTPPYAHWIRRVGAYLIDGILTNVAGVLLWVGYGLLISQSTSTYDPQTGLYQTRTDASPLSLVLLVVGGLCALAFWLWNTCYRAGRTGRSIGKSVVGITLLGETTGRPIGFGLALGRYFLHILDGLPCYLGYLWPLWDRKRQTFADKIVGSIVVVEPREVAAARQ